ncbi:MAG: sulfatase-like hydrolase/transferase, partial [Bacteroidota bacterium]
MNLRIICCYLLCFSCLACKQNESIPREAPNIICLIAEDISPALGAYADAYAHTPRLDHVAAQGLSFDLALSTAPICAPSRSCLMTGIYATSLGTQHLRSEVNFPSELSTLPEILSKHGYFTSNRDKSDYNFDPEGRWEHWSSSYA